MTPDEITVHVKKLYNQYDKLVLQQKRTRWREFYQKYNSFLDAKRKGGRDSTLFVPRCFDSVETIVPRLLLAIYSVNPPFQMAPRAAGDVEFADTLTSTYAYYSDITNQYSTVAQTLRNVAIYGTGIIKCGWDNLKKQPVRYSVDIHEFFIDPAAREIEEAEWCGDVKVRSLSYLRKMEKAGIYKNIDAVQKDGEAYAQPSNLLTDNMTVKSLMNPYELKRQMDADKQYQVLECWIDGGKQVATLAGGVLIRLEENPFPHGEFPYAPVKMTPDTSEFHGIGAIEPIRWLQDMVNDTTNAQLDYIFRSVNQIMLVGVSEWENSSQWRYAQGAKFKVNNMDSVRPLDMRALPPESFAMATQLHSHIDRTLSLSDYVRGTKSGTGESATGASLMAQAADTRLKLQLFYAQHYLKRMVNLEAKCIQEWVPEQFVIRLTEKNYVKPVSRQDIQGEFDVYAAGIADLSTKETKRAQLTNLLNMILTTGAPQLLALQGKKLDMAGLLKQIFDTYELKNPDTLMSDVEPTPIPGVGGMQAQPTDMTSATNMGDLMKSQAEAVAPMQLNPFQQ
jgi:hypothetical protein